MKKQRHKKENNKSHRKTIKHLSKKTIKKWTENAIDKNYTKSELADVLEKHSFSDKDIKKIMSFYDSSMKKRHKELVEKLKKHKEHKKPKKSFKIFKILKLLKKKKPKESEEHKKLPFHHSEKLSDKKTEKKEKEKYKEKFQETSAKKREFLSKKKLREEFKKIEYEHIDKISGRLLEKYPLEVDGAKVEVEIRRDKTKLMYYLKIPKISTATLALLDDIRDNLISITSISIQEILDPEAFLKIKRRFREDAERLLREKLSHENKDLFKFLIGRLMQEMLGLGEMEFLINDPHLEEIVVPSSKEPIRVYSKKYGWITTNLTIKREEEIINYSDIIARRVGRQINVLNPLLDAHLVTGDRVNAVLYPINTKGNTITIRKFARNPYTMVDLINNKTCDAKVASLIWLAVEYEMNVLISGGTAAGKTSFLNACLPFIPPNHRIISIEDTRELMLPDFLYWTPLVTRSPNPEGKGEITMLDLLVNSLRMRPDRIILGEMRKEEEARVLFEAMHTGHSVYATVHADSAAETISRLINPPLNVPANLLRAINLNIVMFRDRKKGLRRVLQIAEIEAGGDSASANIIYRWVPSQDKIVKYAESSRFFEDISRHTGLSQSEINKELKEREEILTYLAKNQISRLEDFGKVLNMYYTDKEKLIESIKKGTLKKTISRIK